MKRLHSGERNAVVTLSHDTNHGNKNALLCTGVLYFPGRRGSKYHRACALSLLCSEWEEVGHTQVKHQHARTHSTASSAPRTNQLIEIESIATDMISFPFARIRANGTSIGVISTPRLNTLPCVHREPINLVVFQDPMVSHLGRGFALRCFQRLSRPNIATWRFTWWQSQ